MRRPSSGRQESLAEAFSGSDKKCDQNGDESRQDQQIDKRRKKEKLDHDKKYAPEQDHFGEARESGKEIGHGTTSLGAASTIYMTDGRMR
jgi:hypothetical protein